MAGVLFYLGYAALNLLSILNILSLGKKKIRFSLYRNRGGAFQLKKNK